MKQSWALRLSIVMKTTISDKQKPVYDEQRFQQPVPHYGDVIMNAMASQITGVSIVYSTFCSGADHRIHQHSMSLAFVRGIHR